MSARCFLPKATIAAPWAFNCAMSAGVKADLVGHAWAGGDTAGAATGGGGAGAGEDT